jgi:hypothetical protein
MNVTLSPATAKGDALDRVDADLARGHTHAATQRLGSLVKAHPTDLDLRLRLAAVHRRVGNPIEAGRWSYLSPEADEAEVRAFERAYPAPAQRLRRLCWPAAGGYPATEFARDRLAALTEAAGFAAVPGAPVTAPLRLRHRLALAVATAVTAPFAVLGAVTVVQWIVN